MKSQASVAVRVPATIANLGPGFDSFGMAVSLYNQFEWVPAERDALRFSPRSTVDTQGLCTDKPGENILFQAMDRLYALSGKTRPAFQVTGSPQIPVTRGLGSSSTAIVAGLLAANHFLGKPFSQDALLHQAVEMEGHPDNVAPAMLGGVVLYDQQPYRLPWPLEWRVLAISPDYPVLTEEARRLLPQSVPLADSIFNVRKASLLTYALLQADPDAFRASLHDRLHQPYRRKLIREYDAVEQVALETGAMGMIISGSGSSMAIFYPLVAHSLLVERLGALQAEKGWVWTVQEVSVDLEGAVLSETCLE